MGKLGFYFDMTSCVGCRTCQVACKDKNDLEVGTLFRNVVSYETGDEKKPGIFYLSRTCNHCENPACAAACPTGAMYKSEEGPVLHDAEMCIGCQACVSACPYEVPQYLEEKNLVGKCDTCISIRREGHAPQCVSACIMRALEFGDLDELKKKHPDAVSVGDLPIVPESKTNPTSLVTPKKIVSAEARKTEF